MKQIVLMFLFFAPATLSAAVLSGQVRDEKTGELLVGANVYLETHAGGTATDLDGNFAIPNVSEGSHTLVISFVGYKEYRNTVTVKEGMGALVVALIPEAVQFEEVVVSAPRAKLRETPIAFSDVPKSDIDRKLGSRSLPMLLNDTPGVYATEQGGGDGDSRINVRGFDQRNIAVMVNGVPVNNMETGWVYWVDWDVLSDVTSSIQVQRGLGASNLAIASVGGTLNIIRKPVKPNSFSVGSHGEGLKNPCFRRDMLMVWCFSTVAHCTRQCGRWSGVQVRQHFINKTYSIFHLT